MKRSFKSISLSLGILVMTIVSSCKKEGSASSADSAASLQAAVAATQSVAVATNGTTSPDSVYVTHTCEPRDRRDSIAATSLPATVTAYLAANYAGSTVVKAFRISDASGNLKGYVTIINFNGNPVGIAFDSSGNFIRVLEQREGNDLREGRGFHDGGRFQCRDGRQRDTVAISALPASISSYFATNYPADSLLRAGRTRDSGYVVLSKNNGLFATSFSSTGNFISRVQLPAPAGSVTAIDAAALPAAITAYLTNTYPGYVFNKAFSISINGTVQGYCVAIEANSTKYGLLFDASGNLIAARAIR